MLLRARAIEAELFVVAAAQAGRHEDGRETYGHSLVADPWGEVLLEMGGEPGLAFAEIDLARIAEVRARIPVLPASPADRPGRELIKRRAAPKGRRSGSVAQQDRATVS